MDFEPIKKENHIKSFLTKNIYLLILGIMLLLGTSYSLTFFIQNKKIGDITMNVGGLSCEVSSQDINISNMKPENDNLGLISYQKELIITNTSNLNGKIELNLTRLSGIEFNNLRYGLYLNGILTKIDNVPQDGRLYNLAILGNETLNVRLSLWIKNDYEGNEQVFRGIINPNITLDTMLASTFIKSFSDLNNNYAYFNDNLWRIKEISDGRLLLTSDDYLSDEFTNSFMYTDLPFIFDNRLIVSVSMDNNALYLKKTVKIIGGNGTKNNPYILDSDSESVEDRKIIAHITYMDGMVPINFIEPIYYDSDNYISGYINDPTFIGWSKTNNGNIDYNIGDQITFTSDTNLYAVRKSSTQVEFDNELNVNDEIDNEKDDLDYFTQENIGW